MLGALDEENARLVESFNAAVAEHAAVRTMMHQARAIITEAFGRDAEFLQTGTSAFSKLSTHIKAFKPLADSTGPIVASIRRLQCRHVRKLDC